MLEAVGADVVVLLCKELTAHAVKVRIGDISSEKELDHRQNQHESTRVKGRT